jgi:hypothetical protein
MRVGVAVGAKMFEMQFVFCRDIGAAKPEVTWPEPTRSRARRSGHILRPADYLFDKRVRIPSLARNLSALGTQCL